MTKELEKINASGIADISHIKETMDNVYKVLSTKPSVKNIKKHPFLKKKVNDSRVPVEYLEIGYIEAQLDRLFLSWDWEIKNAQHTVNGFVVYGTLTVLTLNGNKISRSGIGGVEYKTVKDSGKLKLDLSNMITGTMHSDPGSAESFALSNACKKLGNAFGRGLNREFNFEHIADESITDRIFNTNKKESDE